MTVDLIDQTQQEQTPVIVNNADDAMVVDHHHDSIAESKKIRRKKSRGPFGFFRAISTVLTADTKNKKPPPIRTANIDDDENDTWKNIVGSMRPLHLQQGLNSPSPDHHHLQRHLSVPDFTQYGASSPSPSFSSSSGTMSQYASASNLVALGEEHGAGDFDPDEVFDAITGDEQIDSKAEEFIARFYSQVKVDRHRHQRNKTTQF